MKIHGVILLTSRSVISLQTPPKCRHFSTKIAHLLAVKTDFPYSSLKIIIRSLGIIYLGTRVQNEISGASAYTAKCCSA